MKDPRNKILFSWQVLYLITYAMTFLMACQMTPRDQQEIRLTDIQEDIDNFAIDQSSADSEGASGGGIAEDSSSFSESIDGSNSLSSDNSEEELFIESDQDISNNIPTGDFTKDLDDDSEEINSSTSVNSNAMAGNIDNNSIAGSLEASGESSVSQPTETMVPEAPESSSFDESATFPTTASQASTNAPIANDSMNSSSVEDFSDPQFFNQAPAVPTTPPNTEAMVESPQALSNPEVTNQTGQGLTLSSASLDILPTLHTLTWVGYEIDEKNRELKVEMITKGSPEFRVFQEVNRSNQVELVIRYFQTDLRRKIRWDIDASEFRSPVAYIRMRGDQGKGFVDVVLTLRDSVKPKFYAKDGDIVLTFPIPERYLGNQRVNNMETVDQAQKLNNIDLVLDIQDGSDLPQQATINRPPALPQQIPEQGASSIPIDEVLEDSSEDVFDDEGFPPSFDSSELIPDSHDREELEGLFPIKDYIVRGQSWGMIAQDDLSDNSEDLGESTMESEILSEIEGQSTPSDAPLMKPTTNNQVQNSIPVNSASSTSSPAFSNSVPSADQGASFGAGTNFTQVETPPSNNSEPLFGNEGEEAENGFADLTTSNDLEGRESSTASQAQYNGKLVYMEFTEAPLSIVFKTFSEETGNNFVFPNDVGNLPVTIHFQGVPWDEALKAILETHSLGMVRIGTNVVRVDGIERLTQYMQRLEEAKRFETRRIPTKVLVMRLNNAKATEILTRLEPIINRDREIDPRIQISADERTNSIVMEAP